MKQKTDPNKVKPWRVTFEVPGTWQPIIKSELAKRGQTISQVLHKVMKQLHEQATT
jgi:hypothetical protein